MDTQKIYQTGDHVELAGAYEVVGAKRSAKTTREFALRFFTIGDEFPTYDGNSVAWHLIPNLDNDPKNRPMEGTDDQRGFHTQATT